MKGSRFRARLRYAAAGILEIWRREQSFRTQVAVAVAALLVTAVIGPPPIWWAILTVVIGLVLVAESTNSAIEALADALHPASHPFIKAAKDMAAGSVLLASGAAVVVGVCLLLSVV